MVSLDFSNEEFKRKLAQMQSEMELNNQQQLGEFSSLKNMLKPFGWVAFKFISDSFF
jgi:hypothetical protein